MYLIQYKNPNDPTRYAVRAYDLVRGRLLHAPVVDPRKRTRRCAETPSRGH